MTSEPNREIVCESVDGYLSVIADSKNPTALGHAADLLKEERQGMLEDVKRVKHDLSTGLLTRTIVQIPGKRTALQDVLNWDLQKHVQDFNPDMAPEEKAKLQAKIAAITEAICVVSALPSKASDIPGGDEPNSRLY